MKCEKQVTLILENAQKINDLHIALKESKETTFDEKKVKHAAEQFHRLYDQLAFPGGLQAGMALLKKNDASITELAITYLEANPYFFRSGYIKEEIAHILKRAPLSQDQKERLYKVLLSSASDKDQRKWKAYCNLATVIANSDFCTQLNTSIAHAADQGIREHLSDMHDAILKVKKTQ